MRQLTVEEVFAHALRSHRAGRLAEAEQSYRRILQQHPEHSDSLHLLGVIALQTGHPEPALELIRRAVAQRPDAAVYRNNLGQVLERLGRRDEARAEYEAAIERDPDYAEAFNNLGYVLALDDRLGEAEADYRKAIALDAGYAEPHTNLGNVLKDRGELDEAIAEYRRAVELRPDLPALYSNLLLTLHYHPGYSPEDLAREHRAWAERYVAPLAGERRPLANDADPDRRLRIGYVSADFREHPVARFMLPLLERHERQRTEVFVYADVTRPDAMTDELRVHADVWRDISALSDAAVAKAVREDAIDILVDLAAHSARNRLLVFARKPAPVQVTYLGYCSTTGVDAIDYRLTDRSLDPPDSDLRHYTERSVWLPDCYWCYPAPTLPEDEMPLARREPGTPTFGCLNNFAKVTPQTLRLWAELLERVPEARLIVHGRAGIHNERVQSVLGAAGIEAERIICIGSQRYEDYLSTYREIDVALDPFPFAGGTTTCDALWMGVPVVTLVGRTAVSRGGMSLLTHVGLDDLVARTEDEYVAFAARLIHDCDRLATLRHELRPRLEASALMDVDRFVQNLETAYRTMWRSWCEAQPAE